MTIDDAIKYSEEGARYLHNDHLYIQERGVKLGIEALKAVKECRASHMFCPGLIMPGETEK